MSTQGEVMVATGQAHERDAVALGAWLGASLDLRLRVVLADRSAEHFADNVARSKPAMVVFGSEGKTGETAAGTHARHLIERNVTTVAIAPVGYSKRAARSRHLIGAAYAGGENGDCALDLAADVALDTGGTLIAICVGDSETWDFRELGYGSVTESLIEKDRFAKRALHLADETLDGSVRHGVRFARGSAARELSRVTRDLDLLVVGAHGSERHPGLAELGDISDAIDGLEVPVVVAAPGARHESRPSVSESISRA